MHDCLSADFPDDGSKMVGCQAETVGIEGDGMFTSGMLVDESGEAMKNIFLTADGTTLPFCVFLIMYKVEFVLVVGTGIWAKPKQNLFPWLSKEGV